MKFHNSNVISKYWKNKLKGRETNIRFNSNKNNCSQILLNYDELTYLKKITNNNTIAENTIIVAIYNFLLKRFFNEYDGFIVSSYNSQTGFFALSLPIYLNVSFRDYLQECKAEILETLNYVSTETDPISELKGFNDCDVLSNYGINFNGVTKHECNGLMLDIKTDIENIQINAFYSEGFINESVFINLVGHLADFLINLESNIDIILSEYPLLSDNDKHNLLFNFNNTEAEYPKDKTIVDLFQEQTLRTPNNSALVFQERELSYKELNEKANQLANAISLKYGVKKRDTVGVFLPKSDAGIIAALAILKLGAIYLPVDTNYPQERIEYLINDSSLKLLISKDTVSREFNCDILNFDLIELEDFGSENICEEISVTDVAYLIYTSGSTGQPKGVMIEHGSNVNMSLDQIRLFNITSKDKVVWFASVSFDASISEIMMCLFSGATLYIPEEEQIKDKDQFVLFLKHTKSTVVTFPPNYLGLLNQDDISGLRCIITAGEPANSEKAQEIAKSGIDYYNAYGPTECAVCVSIHKVTTHDFGKPFIPIGKPIANTQIYILDDALRPVPIGISGKIYVSGKGLAKGYLNKPKLTSEKFIPNPFLVGTRIYDTGDLGCWLPDGNIEFLGRKDNQVKLRGYRIELGEIENTILQFSANIKQAVVEVTQHNNDKVLVAYFVATSYIDKAALRIFLQDRLPQYMLPGFYKALEKLPLTPNGKINRKELPGINEIVVARSNYVGPTNKTEDVLVTIWQDVLGLEKIGITDNFFEMGGHSLMISQIINRIRKQLGKTITFKTFFANSTIMALGKQLNESHYEPIPKSSQSASYPLTTSQNSIWVLSQSEDGSLAYNMPAAVKLSGFVDFEKFQASFRILVQRHEILRTYFKSDQHDQVHQYILPSDQVSFTIEVKDFIQSENQDVAIARYLKQISNEPFDLEKVPLIRASLITLKEKEYVFFLSLHHIISDGWSIELLIQEVVGTYNNLVAGRKPDLPALNIQYKDYAVWLNEEVHKEKYISSERYWLKKFGGTIPVLDFPGANKRPLVHTFNGNSVNCQFSKEFSDKLYTFSKKHDVTLFMTLMAGINALLYKYTGQDDIIIGTPAAGREHPDLENQLGLYLNTLAVRTQFNGRDSFLVLLSSQKDMLLEAYEHQCYPFNELVKNLNLKRNPSRSVLFDIWVVLQNQSRLNNINIEKIDGIDISSYDYQSNTSKFDIMFSFSEAAAISLNITYNSDIYGASFIEKIFPDIETLLSKAIESPEMNIKELTDFSQSFRKNNVQKLSKLLK